MAKTFTEAFEERASQCGDNFDGDPYMSFEHEARAKAAEDEIEWVARRIFEARENRIQIRRRLSWDEEDPSNHDMCRDYAAAAISAMAAYEGGGA